MMLMGGPRSKKIATIIVDRIKDSGGPKISDEGSEYSESKPDNSDSEMDGGSVLKAAARSIISAARDGDTDNMVDALKTFFTQCYEDHESAEADGYDDMHNKNHEA